MDVFQANGLSFFRVMPRFWYRSSAWMERRAFSQVTSAYRLMHGMQASRLQDGEDAGETPALQASRMRVRRPRSRPDSPSQKTGWSHEIGKPEKTRKLARRTCIFIVIPLR